MVSSFVAGLEGAQNHLTPGKVSYNDTDIHNALEHISMPLPLLQSRSANYISFYIHQRRFQKTNRQYLLYKQVDMFLACSHATLFIQFSFVKFRQE